LSRPIHLAVSAVGLALSLQFAACSKPASESELLASAQTHFDKRDYRAAGIELRNALQSNPNSARARTLLGRSLFELGEPGLAVVELRKALELGQPEADVLPVMTEAMMQLGQYKRIVDDYAAKVLPDALANAKFQTAVATSLNILGRRADAEKVLKGVMEATPAYLPARIFRARLSADSGDIDRALTEIDAVIKADPRNVEALRVRGDFLLYAKDQSDAALESYRRALEVDPDDLSSNIAVISLHLALQRVNDAAEQFKHMQKRYPAHVQTKFFEAQFAFAKRDHLAVREQLLQLAKVMPNNPRVLELAGLNEIALHSLVRAETYFGKAVQLQPEGVSPRLALAEVQLRLGQPAKAIATLSPLLDPKRPPVPRVLAVAADAQLASGDAERAEKLYAMASKARPADVRLQTGRALAMLAGGQTQVGLGELTRIASADTGMTADMALVAALLRRGDLPAALKAVARLEAKHPESALVVQMRGDLSLRTGDRASARTAFERAIAIDPAFFPAIAGLAALEQADGNPKAAAARFEALLKKDPKHVPALVALARQRLISGDGSGEATKLLQEAIAAAPADPSPRLALIDLHLRRGDAKTALAAAREAESLMPDRTDLLDALGRSLLAAGEPQQALSIYGKWSLLEPKAAAPHVRSADIHASRANWDAALASYRRALAVEPDATAPLLGIVRVEMINKRYDQALAVAKSVQTKRPSSAMGYALEGDIEMTRKRLDAAIAAYRQAMAKQDASTEVANKGYMALMATGRADQAEALASEWIKVRPNDAEFVFSVGKVALARNDLTGAERRFARVLELHPQNAPAMNNIAWIMVQQKRQGAVAMAEKAVALAPDQPDMLDTLARALALEGKLPRAIEVQKTAVAKAGTAAEPFRLQLARLYIDSREDRLAEQELAALAALGDKFGDQAEVQRLRRSLAK
jgi:putative PEP-CTERM system TPR-repeat lipoprotein